MKIDELFHRRACPLALEIFPPKRDARVESIYKMLQRLAGVKADYVSVTYSAGGSGAREYTAQIARHLKGDLGIEPLAHLTCISSTRDGVQRELSELRQSGIQNVLALRGDKPLQPGAAGEYAHASDLIADISAFGGFYIAAACYPEGHPDSENLLKDIDSLLIKLDAGAGHFISQLFFDNGKFFRFLNLSRKRGVRCPIEAGVMPIVRKQQIERTIALSSASLPSAFTRMVSRYADDAASLYDAGIDYAITQVRDLIESGVDGIHLYTMNNAAVAQRVVDGVSDLL